jgi:hypothetical protein
MATKNDYTNGLQSKSRQIGHKSSSRISSSSVASFVGALALKSLDSFSSEPDRFALPSPGWECDDAFESRFSLLDLRPSIAAVSSIVEK